MSPFAWETTLHWSAVALYIAGTVGFAWALIFAHPEKVRGAVWVTAAGLLPHTAALLLRYLRVGHGPYMLKYEVLSSNAWIAIAMLLTPPDAVSMMMMGVPLCLVYEICILLIRARELTRERR